MVPGLAKTYAATGALWAKPAPDGFHWGGIEPKPPEDGTHTYDWSGPDRLIREYQQAGFRHFHVYTQVRNRWAGTQELVGNASLPPKPEFLKGYAQYLRSMVERYDGDGKDDMPGLVYPVRYWEIEAEWGTFWKGTADQYLDLLRVAHQAVKQADPQAKVILQGFLMMGIFDGDPDQQALDRLMSHPVHGPKIRQGRKDIARLLSRPELFDAVEFHSLGDWTEIAGAARFLRGEMEKNGYQKPIWVGDVNYSLNPMIFWGQPFYPYTPEQKDEILKWLRAMGTASDPRHEEAVRWFRAEQASFTAKKIVCAAGEGLAGINMGNLEDWPQFGLVRGVTGTAAFCGLIDVKGFDPADRKLPLGLRARIPGQPRPAYWTMKLLIDKLGSYTAAQRLNLGKGVYAYRFLRPAAGWRGPKATTVLWHDDRRGPLPGQPAAEATVALATQARRAALVRIITAPGEERPKSQPLPVQNGRIKVTIGQTPVIVEEYALSDVR
jgi:hypothetical protein